MTIEMGFIPEVQNERLIRPRRVHQSEFTGYTQRYGTLGQYWTGSFTPPPFSARRDEGQWAAWRKFLALVESPVNDGTFWLPLRGGLDASARCITFPEGSTPATSRLEVVDLINSTSMQVRASTNSVIGSPDGPRFTDIICIGDPVQVHAYSGGVSNFNANFIVQVVGVSDNGTILTTPPLPDEFVQIAALGGTRLAASFGLGVRVRAFILSDDALGSISEEGGIATPLEIQWIEAVGHNLQAARSVVTSSSVAARLLLESGDGLLQETGDALLI